jgi:hypothetical protein
MPRDLWYRIVYSQALEAFVSQKHSGFDSIIIIYYVVNS